MANKAIDALVFCPFYVSESRMTITCEGIVGSRTVSRFCSSDEKEAHEKNFCTGKWCRGCGVHSAIMQNYSPVPAPSGTQTLRC